jgi:hypothetical protein
MPLPKKPLNQEQMDELGRECFARCKRIYENGMIKSGFGSSFQIDADAWIAMQEVMKQFDLSKTSEELDEDLKHITEIKKLLKIPTKTLETHFMDYFQLRVGFMFTDASLNKLTKK